ncbi:MAG: stage III sporulation protein AF [Limnochordales bacterium]
MGWLAGWVRDLVVVVFFVSAAFMLLPENRLRDYVRFMAGLVVIGALLAPALQLLRWDPGDADWFGGFPQGAENVAAEGELLARRALERVAEEGRRRAYEHVAGVVELALGAAPEQLDVRWRPDGGIEGIDATVGPADGPVDADRAVRLIAGYLGLRPEQVRVRAAEHGGQGGMQR